MSFGIRVIFRRLLVCLLVVSIISGAGVVSFAAHPIAATGKFACETATDQSVSLRLDKTDFEKSVDHKVDLGSKSVKSETDSRKASGSVCCSAICSPSAMLAQVLLPDLRADLHGSWTIFLAELVPAAYVPLRRPPRSIGEIDWRA